MEELVKCAIEKISTYHILNYFFPGIIFCWLIDKVTQNYQMSKKERVQTTYLLSLNIRWKMV